MNAVRTLLICLCTAILAIGIGSAAGAATAVPNQHSASEPVLVIGGFAADPIRLESLRSWLSEQGYTAYSMMLPGSPTAAAPAVVSAHAVADKVTEVRHTTGAAQVDLVGHSMGGLAQRHYLKFLGGRDSVGTYVDLGTPHSGETMAWFCYGLYPGCRDLVPTSPFLAALNKGAGMPPGLPAYHLSSAHAGSENAPLPGAVNASVQSFCPGRTVSHADEPSDTAFQQLVDSALSNEKLTTTCP